MSTPLGYTAGSSYNCEYPFGCRCPTCEREKDRPYRESMYSLYNLPLPLLNYSNLLLLYTPTKKDTTVTTGSIKTYELPSATPVIHDDSATGGFTLNKLLYHKDTQVKISKNEAKNLIKLLTEILLEKV